MRQYNFVLPAGAHLPDPGISWNSPSPIALEIGCGRGLFAIQFTQTHPDWRYIGIERTQKIHGLYSRLKNHPQAKGAVAVRADAPLWIARYVPNASIDRIFILYPNPYPKNRQRNLRWHNMPFYPLLLHKLKAGGILTLATNMKFYADEAIVQSSALGLRLTSDATVDPTRPARTHFEKKYLLRGDTCRNLEFQWVPQTTVVSN